MPRANETRILLLVCWLCWGWPYVFCLPSPPSIPYCTLISILYAPSHLSTPPPPDLTPPSTPSSFSNASRTPLTPLCSDPARSHAHTPLAHTHAHTRKIAGTESRHLIFFQVPAPRFESPHYHRKYINNQYGRRADRYRCCT